MDRQKIIDAISFVSCAYQDRSILVYANKQKTATEFVRKVLERIPNYVGYDKNSTRKFKSSSGNEIVCAGQNNLSKGRSLTLLVILNDVEEKQREFIKTSLYPCMTYGFLLEEAYDKSHD